MSIGQNPRAERRDTASNYCKPDAGVLAQAENRCSRRAVSACCETSCLAAARCSARHTPRWDGAGPVVEKQQELPNHASANKLVWPARHMGRRRRSARNQVPHHGAPMADWRPNPVVSAAVTSANQAPPRGVSMRHATPPTAPRWLGKPRLRAVRSMPVRILHATTQL